MITLYPTSIIILQAPCGLPYLSPNDIRMNFIYKKSWVMRWGVDKLKPFKEMEN